MWRRAVLLAIVLIVCLLGGALAGDLSKGLVVAGTLVILIPLWAAAWQGRGANHDGS
jgi:hypothetical protein